MPPEFGIDAATVQWLTTGYMLLLVAIGLASLIMAARMGLAGRLRGGVGRVRTHAAEDQPSVNRHFPSFAAVADALISK